MNVLVIAPLHDLPTSISNVAVSKLIDWMNRTNIKYTLLRAFAANRVSVNAVNYFNRKVSELFEKERFNAVFYYGHGEEDRVGDFMMRLIPIISTNNIHKFAGMIMYTMACLTGKELARVAIENGVRAYFGQTVRYFASLNNLGTKYNFLNDWYDLVNTIPIALMKGKTAAQALNDYENLANHLYAKYLLINSEINIEVLYSNARHLELYGNPHAKLI